MHDFLGLAYIFVPMVRVALHCPCYIVKTNWNRRTQNQPPKKQGQNKRQINHGLLQNKYEISAVIAQIDPNQA
jgi:hypothetical protein